MVKEFEAVNISVKATLSFRDYKQDLHAKMLDLEASETSCLTAQLQSCISTFILVEDFSLNTNYILTFV